MNANRGAAGPVARPAPGGMGRGPMGGGGPMAGLGMTGQKAKNFRGTLFRLVGYFGPEKWLLILVLVAAIIIVVSSVTGRGFVWGVIVGVAFFAASTGWSWWRFRQRAEREPR